jgi:hypothetical protein
MTTNTVTFPPSDRLRRFVVAVVAGAAIVASIGLVVSRASDRDSSVGASAPEESTLDVTLLNGAIHVFTAPDEVVVAAPQESTLDLTLLNGAIHVFTAPDLPGTHPWASHPLPGIGDIVADMVRGG